MSEKIAIVGSRKGIDKAQFVAYVQTLPSDVMDTWAEEAARQMELHVEIYRPDWNKSPWAALERNTTIVENADRIVAFWNGYSEGTIDTIRKANLAGKQVTFVWPEDDFSLNSKA